MKIAQKVNNILLSNKQDCEYMPPWYYGYAYRDILRDQSVFAVMPLNWLIRWWHNWIWAWDEFRGKPPEWAMYRREDIYDMRRAEYQRGYDEALAFFTKNIPLRSPAKVFYKPVNETEFKYLGECDIDG